MSGLVPETAATSLSQALSHGQPPLLIDVRTPGEFAEGHIAGAINIPLSELPSRIDELETPKSQQIVTICRSAKRTISATRFLLQLGYQDTRQLAGGMIAWRDAGLPVVEA